MTTLVLTDMNGPISYWGPSAARPTSKPAARNARLQRRRKKQPVHRSK